MKKLYVATSPGNNRKYLLLNKKNAYIEVLANYDLDENTANMEYFSKDLRISDLEGRGFTVKRARIKDIVQMFKVWEGDPYHFIQTILTKQKKLKDKPNPIDVMRLYTSELTVNSTNAYDYYSRVFLTALPIAIIISVLNRLLTESFIIGSAASSIILGVLTFWLLRILSIKQRLVAIATVVLASIIAYMFVFILI